MDLDIGKSLCRKKRHCWSILGRTLLLLSYSFMCEGLLRNTFLRTDAHTLLAYPALISPPSSSAWYHVMYLLDALYINHLVPRTPCLLPSLSTQKAQHAVGSIPVSCLDGVDRPIFKFPFPFYDNIIIIQKTLFEPSWTVMEELVSFSLSWKTANSAPGRSWTC